MNKKSSQKAKKTIPEYDSERENRVLLEQMNKSINLVAEQHGSIKQEIKQEIHQLKEGMEQRFNMLEMAVMENNKHIRENSVKIDRVEKKIDTNIANHEKRITRLEDKVSV
ncbi:MAG: hypothetical protein KAS13_06835 [Candidatus Omnitrophica bacterium]|nr:hypothetical protein [Candidatus Omnitrophota bacterium]MCK5592400.1 hypothetical protein [Candidatus Paceibacterota bacterium]